MSHNIARSPLQIGINARLFPSNWRPALQEIDFARDSGFESLQFHGYEQGLGAERLGGPLPAVAEALEASGLTAVMEIIVRFGLNGRTAGGATALAMLEA